MIFDSSLQNPSKHKPGAAGNPVCARRAKLTADTCQPVPASRRPRLQSSHRMDQRLTPAALRKLRHALLTWYEEHRRELPWRCDADPYRVWVSEIMLQQTRVAAVVDHYARFLQKFPTVQTLAGAREASVLAVWSGLGYYHRARRMHQAAKLIARQRRGIFPRTAEEWRELPGIGRTLRRRSRALLSGKPWPLGV